MMASLFSGVSGLKNHQTKMNVIGNNIANINTIGFKGARVNFQEALVQTFRGAGRPSPISGGTNPVQLGLGMQVASIDTMFQQGGLETTGQITDLAIQGSGFFILGDYNNNRYYTRAGAFNFDSNSNLVDPATGLYVLGRNADANGNIPSLGTTGPITIPFGQQDPAKATEVITLANNLNISATDSYASLVNDYAAGSGVTTISGIADDGVGGVHSIEITGTQALNDSLTGVHDAGSFAGSLLETTLLSDIGVTVFDDFQITIDGVRTEPVMGINSDTTVGQLINSINNISGITAELVGGEIQITRDKAGDPSLLNFTLSDGAAGNIASQIFGAGVGVGLSSAGGAANTFVAIDTFTPDIGYGTSAGPFSTQLDIITDDSTGRAIGLEGLGGGGVSIEAEGGLSATNVGENLKIKTEPTLHSMSVSVYDSLGEQHTLSIEFFKSAINNRWEWTASSLEGETITDGGSGYVSFNNDASLNTFSYNGGATSITIDPGNGADVLNVAIDAGTSNNFDGLTGFSSAGHTASVISQDGYGLGILEKISIDQAGNISGFFSNGVTRVLAQIMLADFSNQAGLRKAGLNRYQPSANSGEALEGVAGTTISGSISSGALEASSVDIAAEFTSMITAQRGFQANARIITTSDSMLDELVNIKR